MVDHFLRLLATALGPFLLGQRYARATGAATRHTLARRVIFMDHVAVRRVNATYTPKAITAPIVDMIRPLA